MDGDGRMRTLQSEAAPSLDELYELAAAYEMTVHRVALPHGMLGCCVPLKSRIYLDTGLTHVEERSVLAHELGHAFYGHARLAPESPAQADSWERQADAFAARLLIKRDAYASLARVYTDPVVLAEALDVTVDVVESYRALVLAVDQLH